MNQWMGQISGINHYPLQSEACHENASKQKQGKTLELCLWPSKHLFSFFPRSFVKVQEVQRNIHFSRVKLPILGACGSVTYLQIGPLSLLPWYSARLFGMSEWTFPFLGLYPSESFLICFIHTPFKKIPLGLKQPVFVFDTFCLILPNFPSSSHSPPPTKPTNQSSQKVSCKWYCAALLTKHSNRSHPPRSWGRDNMIRSLLFHQSRQVQLFLAKKGEEPLNATGKKLIAILLEGWKKSHVFKIAPFQWLGTSPYWMFLKRKWYKFLRRLPSHDTNWSGLTAIKWY